MLTLTTGQIATITLISTVVVAVITGYYAVITHKMLNSQKEMAELEKRPFLKVNKVVIKTYLQNENSSKGKIQLGVELENVSHVLLKYKMTNLITSIENVKNVNPVLINNGGYVYPSQTTTFTDDAIDNIDFSKEVIKGEIEYEMEYYSVEKKKYKSIRHYQVTFFTKSNYIDWKSISENEIELK